MIEADELECFTRDVPVAAPWSVVDAEIVARHLVRANLSGVDRHSVTQLPTYVDHLRNGWLDGTAEGSIVSRGHGHALVNPDRGGPWMRNQGVTFVFIGDDLLISAETYRALADDMGRRVRRSRPRPSSAKS